MNSSISVHSRCIISEIEYLRERVCVENWFSVWTSSPIITYQFNVFRGVFMIPHFTERLQNWSIQYRLATSHQGWLYLMNCPLARFQEISYHYVTRWNTRYVESNSLCEFYVRNWRTCNNLKSHYEITAYEKISIKWQMSKFSKTKKEGTRNGKRNWIVCTNNTSRFIRTRTGYYKHLGIDDRHRCYCDTSA